MSGIETGNRRHSRRDAMRQGVRGFARRARRNVQNLEAIGVVGATLLTGKGDIAARSNRQPSSPITASYQEQSGSHTQEETNNQRQTKERSPRKSHPKPPTETTRVKVGQRQKLMPEYTRQNRPRDIFTQDTRPNTPREKIENGDQTEPIRLRAEIVGKRRGLKEERRAAAEWRDKTSDALASLGKLTEDFMSDIFNFSDLSDRVFTGDIDETRLVQHLTEFSHEFIKQVEDARANGTINDQDLKRLSSLKNMSRTLAKLGLPHLLSNITNDEDKEGKPLQSVQKIVHMFDQFLLSKGDVDIEKAREFINNHMPDSDESSSAIALLGILAIGSASILLATKGKSSRNRALILAEALIITVAGCSAIHSISDSGASTASEAVCIFEEDITKSDILSEREISQAEYDTLSPVQKALLLRQGGYVSEWNNGDQISFATRIAQESATVVSQTFNTVMGITVPQIVVHSSVDTYIQATQNTETTETESLGEVTGTYPDVVIHINIPDTIGLNVSSWERSSDSTIEYNNILEKEYGVDSPGDLEQANTITKDVFDLVVHEASHQTAKPGLPLTDEDKDYIKNATAEYSSLANYGFTERNMSFLSIEMSDGTNWTYLPFPNPTEWLETQRTFIQQVYYDRLNLATGAPAERQIQDLDNGVALWSYINKKLGIPDSTVAEWLIDNNKDQREITNLVSFYRKYQEEAARNGIILSSEQIFSIFLQLGVTINKTNEADGNMISGSYDPGDPFELHCDAYEKGVEAIDIFTQPLGQNPETGQSPSNVIASVEPMNTNGRKIAPRRFRLNRKYAIVE